MPTSINLLLAEKLCVIKIRGVVFIGMIWRIESMLNVKKGNPRKSDSPCEFSPMSRPC